MSLGPQLFTKVDRSGARTTVRVPIYRETDEQRQARLKAYSDDRLLPWPHKHRHPPKNFIQTPCARSRFSVK